MRWLGDHDSYRLAKTQQVPELGLATLSGFDTSCGGVLVLPLFSSSLRLPLTLQETSVRCRGPCRIVDRLGNHVPVVGSGVFHKILLAIKQTERNIRLILC